MLLHNMCRLSVIKQSFIFVRRMCEHFHFYFQVAVDMFIALALFDGHQEQLPACKYTHSDDHVRFLWRLPGFLWRFPGLP